MRRLTLLVAVLSLVACSDNGITDVEDPAEGQVAFYVDRLAVAIVEGGEETIVVQARDGSVSEADFTAGIEDPSVATITATDTDIVVTGVGIGATTVTIEDVEGETRRIPVRVYDPIVADFGELLLRFWTDFSRSTPTNYEAPDPVGLRGYWPDSNENRYYHPNVMDAGDGWFALGSIVLRTGETLDRDGVVLIARADEDASTSSPPLALPSQYELESWSDNGDFNSRAAYYRPVPPDGYRALGEVVRFRNDRPPRPDEVAVVREDLVHYGDLRGSSFWMWLEEGDCWGGLGFHPEYCGAVDDIVAFPGPPRETTYFPVGSFAFYPFVDDEDGTPHDGSRDEVVNVLRLELPTLVESEEQDVIPRLTGRHAPPAQSLPVLSRAILVPFTMITDPEYPDRQDWQLENSPFYRLEREVYYKLLYFNYNQTSVQQENRVEIVSGSVESQSEVFYEETGVSVRKESGIEIGSVTVTSVGGVSFGGETNVSRKLGYATATNIQELREDHTTTTVYTAPGRAAAMWQKYNRFTLKRHMGTGVEIVSVYEFGINEFVTDEFGGD